MASKMAEGKELDQVVGELKRGRIQQTSSSAAPARARPTSPVRRSRAWRLPHSAARDPDFVTRATKKGKLLIPEQDGSRPKTVARPSKPTGHSRRADLQDGISDSQRLIKQPETRPISQEQLVAEVKGIYAGLVMVEAKCIEVDNTQSHQTDTRLNNEQWQALIALHRTLLHEHYDFFLASQHPSASRPFRRLASKYAMPARMWRHIIHSFRELLRHGIHSLGDPGSRSYPDNLKVLTLRFLINRALGLWNGGTCADHAVISKHNRTTTADLDGAIAVFLNKAYTEGLNTLKAILYSLIRRLLQSACVSLLLLFASPAAASTIGRRQALSASQQIEASGPPDGDSTLAWFWYPTAVALILSGQFTASYIMNDHVSVHGVSMKVSAATFLVFAFNQDTVPLVYQISAFFLCTVSATAYLMNDIRTLEPDKRQLAVLTVISIACLLDFKISSMFASAGSNSPLSDSDSPSAASTFAIFLIPCIVVSAFACHCSRDIYHWVRRDSKMELRISETI